MVFDLGLRAKVKNAVSANISNSLRDTTEICTVDIWEIIFGLSVGAMTFGWCHDL